MSNYYGVKGGTEPVYISGQAKYARLSGFDQWGKHSLSIYPDQESMPKVHKLISEGIKNKLVQDEDGYRITFSRPEKIMTKTKGEVVLDTVVVTDQEDHILDNKFIADGTDVTVKLETYGGAAPGGRGRYKAARLQAIKIHGLKTNRPIP